MKKEDLKVDEQVALQSIKDTHVGRLITDVEIHESDGEEYFRFYFLDGGWSEWHTRLYRGQQ